MLRYFNNNNNNTSFIWHHHEGMRIGCTVSILESPIHFLNLKVYKNVWDFLSVPGSCPVRRHNPVAAGIDVTDNCFCSVFFASLYLSSSFNKVALIFHENNEVFVNCEIGCKSTCSTILLLLLGNALVKCRTLKNKREVKSWKNTPKEKWKQNRKWRKQKQQQKNAGNLALLANTEVLLGINDGPNVAEMSLTDKKSLSPNLDTEQVGNKSGLIMLQANSKKEMVSNAKQPRSPTLLDVNCSRSATMLWMALGDNARCKPTQHSKPFVAQTTFQRIVGQKNIHLKSMSDKEFNCNFKELIPEHLEYLTIVNKAKWFRQKF